MRPLRIASPATGSTAAEAQTFFDGTRARPYLKPPRKKFYLGCATLQRLSWRTAATTSAPSKTSTPLATPRC